MDLFEMFGIKVEDQIEEKSKTSSKTENKQKKGKKVEKKAASAKTDAKKLVLPLTVYTGFNRPFLITGTGSTTDKTLRERIHDVTKEFHPDVFTYDVVGDKVWVAFDPAKEVQKGKVKILKESEMFLANHQIDISGIAIDENDMADISVVEDVLKKVHPAFQKIGVVSSADGKLLAPVFHWEVLGNKELSFPVRVCLYGRENFQVTWEEFKNFLNEKGYNVEEDVKFDANILQQYIETKYPEYDKKHTKLLYMEKENIVLPVISIPENKKPVSAKKTEKFPTKDTTLSFIFEKIPLTPELFGGKEEVSEKELLAFCADKYPEYASESAKIFYDKKLRILFPRIEGARKGASAWV